MKFTALGIALNHLATLPGIRELEVVQALKNDEETADIPIVLFVVEEDQDTGSRGRAAGVDRYLVKPFAPPGPGRDRRRDPRIVPRHVVPWVH